MLQLLRLAFRQLAELDFVRAERLEGALFLLDLLTRAPLLLRGLVRAVALERFAMHHPDEWPASGVCLPDLQGNMHDLTPDWQVRLCSETVSGGL